MSSAESRLEKYSLTDAIEEQARTIEVGEHDHSPPLQILIDASSALSTYPYSVDIHLLLFDRL